MKEKLYKILVNGQSCHGGNAEWKKGKWMPKLDGTELCHAGMYHLCRLQDLPIWLNVQNAEVWKAEYRGELIIGDDKVGCREARITHRIGAMTERTHRLFAVDCAEYALQFIVEPFTDIIPTLECCIYVMRCYAENEATEEERSAAWSAAESAWGAAESAARSAWSAARSAAESAARSAAESAARSAWSAAWSAARSAAESARSAAESAARSAARSAAESAWSAARSAARSAAESAWGAAESAWSAARSAARSAALEGFGKKLLAYMRGDK